MAILVTNEGIFLNTKPQPKFFRVPLKAGHYYKIYDAAPKSEGKTYGPGFTYFDDDYVPPYLQGSKTPFSHNTHFFKLVRCTNKKFLCYYGVEQGIGYKPHTIAHIASIIKSLKGSYIDSTGKRRYFESLISPIRYMKDPRVELSDEMEAMLYNKGGAF